jgi:7-cyano-7-deazaguanine reductase
VPAKKILEPTLKTLPKRRPTRPSATLDSFASPRPGRAFEIRFETDEFTCLCPMTGQPDFARLRITYIPDQLCVESKSLKLYLWSYRDRGAFHEAVTNQILDDLVAALAPRWLRVEGDFLIRGGIRTLVSAEHGTKG